MSPSSEAVLRVRLPENVPLHARPAGRLVRAAAAFEAEIVVAANGRRANAKSILEVMGLGATGGAELELYASGRGAAEVVKQLGALIRGLDR